MTTATGAEVNDSVDPSTFTARPNFDYVFPQGEAAIKYQESRQIERHPFILRLGDDLAALTLWVAQEYLISCRFTQDLASWLSTIENCHVRALAMPVLAGEHGPVTSTGATYAHACLARVAAESLGVAISSIRPLPATRDYLEVMRLATGRAMYGAGFFGVGNERLLVPEYSAILTQVHNHGMGKVFEPFLRANISEDSGHADLVARAAQGLASLGHNSDDYYDGAVRGVDSRIRYYDTLEVVSRSQTRAPEELG